MGAEQFEPEQILVLLRQHDVDLVVIGGQAARGQGAAWPTYDVDVVVAETDDNLENLALALSELSAEYNTLHTPPIKPDAQRLKTLSGPQLFRTRLGRLDVLKEAGGEKYDTLIGDSVPVQLGDVVAQYASLEALVRMKRAANRPKDREGLEKLEAALRKRDM